MNDSTQRELERLRELARRNAASDRLHNEAAALRHAAEEEHKKWQLVVTEKDAEIARLLSLLKGK